MSRNRTQEKGEIAGSPEGAGRRKILDLAIVTSCHNYGRWLHEWAASIAAQETYLPKRVAIVDNGSTDLTPQEIEKAVTILEDVGLEVRTERIGFTDFGSARNRAVELGGETEWIQHLDADDKLLPYALEDFAELAPEADVVSFGYRRFGDLTAGPKNRTRTYRKHQGEASLRSTAPASGVSPFRRSFWLQEPYRTDMDGGWDTALWIDFAKLGARFVPTRRPVFLYRQHASSIFNSRRVNDRKSAFTGIRLRNLRRDLDQEGVSVLIPYREDEDGHRARALEFVRDWYREHHPDFEVRIGELTGRTWRKGDAVQEALEASRGWTLVIADGDVVVEPSLLEEAVELVRDGVPWVVPHELVHRLDEATTRRVLEDGPADCSFEDRELIRNPYKGFPGGGLLVVDRSDYEASGGIPADFQGWGAEDEALATILDSLVGPHIRLGGDLFHLYHDPGRRTRHPAYQRNRRLFRILNRLAPDPDALYEALIAIQHGRDPEEAWATVGGRGVLMVAVETFKRGTEKIEKGTTFRATEVEAKRHRARPRTIAREVTGADRTLIHRHSKDRTLDIRTEQAIRNAEIRKEKARREAKRDGAM